MSPREARPCPCPPLHGSAQKSWPWGKGVLRRTRKGSVREASVLPVCAFRARVYRLHEATIGIGRRGRLCVLCSVPVLFVFLVSRLPWVLARDVRMWRGRPRRSVCFLPRLRAWGRAVAVRDGSPSVAVGLVAVQAPPFPSFYCPRLGYNCHNSEPGSRNARASVGGLVTTA